jgi:beta-mannanase
MLKMQQIRKNGARVRFRPVGVFAVKVAAPLVILVFLLNAQSWSTEKAIVMSCAKSSVCLGVFDPSNAMASENKISVEHVFIEWQAEPGRIQSAARQAWERARTLMVTIEPWPWWRWEAPTPNRPPLLSEIVSGRYDTELNVMCGEVASLNQLVYLRWGHEMEGTTGRYPWAGADPAAYISAYRYFVDRCRRIAPQAVFVWSPMGNRGLAPYYPGSDLVDSVGLSLYASEKVERTLFGRTRSATEMVRERYDRVSSYGKPILLAELGVAGSAQYLESWFLDLGANLRRSFPLVSGIAYFNEREPHELPEPFGAPDWRLGAKYFVQTLGRPG